MCLNNHLLQQKYYFLILWKLTISYIVTKLAKLLHSGSTYSTNGKEKGTSMTLKKNQITKRKNESNHFIVTNSNCNRKPITGDVGNIYDIYYNLEQQEDIWITLSVTIGDVLCYKQFSCTDGTGATALAFETKLKYKSPLI